LVLSSNSIFFFSCFCFSFLAFNFYNRNNNHNNNASSLSQFVFNPIIFKKILREILCCSPSPLTIRLTSVSLFLPSYPVHRNLSIHHITFHTNIHPSFTSIACNWVASNLQTYMTNWSYITINSCWIIFLQYTTHLDLIAIFSLSDFFFSFFRK